MSTKVSLSILKNVGSGTLNMSILVESLLYIGTALIMSSLIFAVYYKIRGFEKEC